MELYNSRWRAHCHVKQAPHRLAAAALVDLQQHFLVRGHLLRVGTQHRQLEHREIDALPCALLRAHIAQIDQQRLLPAREVM